MPNLRYARALTVAVVLVAAYAGLGLALEPGAAARVQTACIAPAPTLGQVLLWPITWPLSYGLTSHC